MEDLNQNTLDQVFPALDSSVNGLKFVETWAEQFITQLEC